MARRISQEKVVSARSSATVAGNTVAKIVKNIDGHPLLYFDELLVYLDLNTALVGTSPTFDIYLQRAVVADPVDATDAHWTDLAAFPQATTGTMEKVMLLPYTQVGGTSGAGRVTNARDRTHATMSADAIYPNHWGDQIRIVEKMGGTITTQAIYDVTITGIQHGAP